MSTERDAQRERDKSRGANPDTPWFTTSWEVLYFETDRMGIVHHSNYIRWFEYARVHFLRACGTSFEDLEAGGVESPVVSVSARYLKPSVFGDFLTIAIRCVRYTGVRMVFEYKVLDQAEAIICEGETQHAFALQESHRVISLSRHRPALHNRFNELIQGRAIWEEPSVDEQYGNETSVSNSPD